MADDAPPPIDEYERRYMGGSAPLARSRVGNPWWFHALLGSVTLLCLVGGLRALPETVVPLLVSLLPAFLWIALRFLRVTVTRSHVHIQYGIFGPKIPLESITEAQVETYDPVSYRGWGIKRGNGGWAYSVPGGSGRGVALTYTANGVPRRVFASSDRPEELLAAIEKGRERGALAGLAHRVSAGRVPAGPRVVLEEFTEEAAESDAGRSARPR